MVLLYPVFKDRITVPTIFSVCAVVVVGLAAGITSPRQKWAMVLNVCVAALGFIVAEYYAITQSGLFEDLFFWANQALAMIFFSAFYYAVKTVRGSLPQ